jgi:hypothetical protein
VAGEQDFHQDDGQEDRERIVDAGLDLQGGADAGEQACGRQHVAEGGEPGAQSAVEQDQAERHGTYGVGKLHIVELDAAKAGFARQHADQKEDQQQRGAEAQRDQARHDAGQHQHRAEQDRYAD